MGFETRGQLLDGFRHTMCSARPMTLLKRAGWHHVVRTIRDSPSERHIYCALEADARPVLEALDHAQWAGYPTTLSHFVGRGAALALATLPDSYGAQRKGVDAFFVDTKSQGIGATGTRVSKANQRSVFEISNDLEFCKGRSPDTPSGCAVVSHVTPLGLPISWLLSVPLWVVFSEEVEKVLVIDGASTFGYMLPITFIVDRQYLDGGEIHEAIVAFQDYLANPTLLEAAPRGSETFVASRI